MDFGLRQHDYSKLGEELIHLQTYVRFVGLLTFNKKKYIEELNIFDSYTESWNKKPVFSQH